MHPATTMKQWSHRLHDGMLTVRHQIAEHLRSRHFWVGVGVTLLIAGLIAVFIMLAKNAPLQMRGDFPYGIPYSPYR